MDAGRFDQIVRRWTESGSRRPLLRGLAASAAGLLGAPGVAGKHKKKKKKVTLCLNGSTVSVPKKKQGSYLHRGATAGACANGGGGSDGPCKSDAACNRCARETCQAGVCACPAGMSRDANGICGAPPAACAPLGQTVGQPDQCCSRTAAPVQYGYFCIPGTTQCVLNQDCANGGKCLGGMCPPLYLSVVGQACKAGIGCTSPNDCGDKACRDGVCVSCQSTGQCGTDQYGQCTCENGTCASSHAGAGFTTGVSCESNCPAGTARCGDTGSFTACYPACGKTFACCTHSGEICGGSLCL